MVFQRVFAVFQRLFPGHLAGSPPCSRRWRLAKAAAPWEEAMVTLERKTFDLDIPT